MINIQLNGKSYKIKSNSNIDNLLKKIKVESKKVAVEVNKEVLCKENYKKYKIKINDKIEIVTFVGGG